MLNSRIIESDLYFYTNIGGGKHWPTDCEESKAKASPMTKPFVSRSGLINAQDSALCIFIIRLRIRWIETAYKARDTNTVTAWNTKTTRL
jgi:hypothetical protein